MGVGHPHPKDSIINCMATENNAIALAHREFRKPKLLSDLLPKIVKCEPNENSFGHGRNQSRCLLSLIDCCVSVCVACVNFISFAYNDADLIVMMMIMAFVYLVPELCQQKHFFAAPFSVRASPHGSLPYLSPNSNRDSIEFGVIYRTTLLLVAWRTPLTHDQTWKRNTKKCQRVPTHFVGPFGDTRSRSLVCMYFNRRLPTMTHYLIWIIEIFSLHLSPIFATSTKNARR